jgi:arsenite methyltransferase
VALPSQTTDQWAQWIRERRFGGGDEPHVKRMLKQLAETREKVLDRAELQPGETLLDVGCGDGLIGLGALERGAAEVIFSDVSEPLLDDSRRLAEEAGALERCRFVVAAAEDLSSIEDLSVDAVTTRSVLIYVRDKAAAFDEFLRVLRPGGRFSCFEPINRFGAWYRREKSFWGYPLDDLEGIRDKLDAVYDAIQPRDLDPMVDFDERDLIELAVAAGFFPVRLHLEAAVEPTEPQRWETFLHTAGNPKIPTLAEAMEQALTRDERQRLAAHLRPLVEEGRGTWRMASAYLAAWKPEVR